MQAGLVLSASLPVMKPRLSSAAYAETDVSNGGRMAGTVRFDGELPPFDQILISKDSHICGDGHVVPDGAEVGDDGVLTGAVVAWSCSKMWPRARPGRTR